VPAFTLVTEQWIDRPIEEIFTFFGDATNLESITPPWLRFSVLTPTPIAIGVGTLIDYRLRWRGIPLRWQTLIEEWDPPHRFTDSQIRGPYEFWRHTHTFDEECGGTRIRDEVGYRLPFGLVGAAAHRLGVRRDLEAVFDYRARRVRELFERVRTSS
jgi:ligand-binding SRPBCC domain-containing protein